MKAEEAIGRQTQEMDRFGVRKCPQGSRRQRKIETNCSDIISGAPTTVRVNA